MYRPGDAIALAGQLARVLSMPAEQRRSLGKALRAIVQSSHNVGNLMDKVIPIFEGAENTPGH